MTNNVILRKLDLITSELQKLKELSEISESEYVKDYTKSYTGERIIEKIVGAAIDINTHIIASKGETIPDTYYDSFLALGRIGIFSMDFAKKIAESARMRNKIIHEYEEIETEQVYGSLNDATTQYAAYVKYINDFLSSRKEK